MYKKKDRENARFYKRNRNACMGVYVKIIYSQKETLTRRIPEETGEISQTSSRGKQ